MQKNQNGSSLLEAVVAIGLASLFLWATIGLVIISKQGAGNAQDRQEALWYANQGIDALRTMDFSNLTLTETGNITFAGNTWTLNTNGSQLLDNKYTRTVHVQEAFRDDDCALVSVGGTLDDDSRFLQSDVAWIDGTGRSQLLTLNSFAANWDDMQGMCADMADAITFDFSASTWFGGKQLREIYLTNTSDHDVVIDKFIITWNNANLIQQLFLDTSKIWSSSGPGSPSGEQPSGTELDVQDQTIIAQQDTVEIPKVQFNDQMSGATMQFEIIFEDGSSVVSQEFVPVL